MSCFSVGAELSWINLNPADYVQLKGNKRASVKEKSATCFLYGRISRHSYVLAGLNSPNPHYTLSTYVNL